MYSQPTNGFGATRLFIVGGVILAAIIGVLLMIFLVESTKKQEATALASSFVSHINNQQYEESYTQLSEDQKEEAGQFSGWWLWASSFERGSVTIASEPEETRQDGSTEYTSRYHLSNGLKLDITINQNGGEWYIDNYVVIE